MSDPHSNPSRRDFLTGQAYRDQLSAAGENLLEELADAESVTVPTAADTICLGTRAMACDFTVMMNPAPGDQVARASEALDIVHELEAQMTVYRDESELSQINRTAYHQNAAVESQLFQLLLRSRDLCLETDGAFDPTSGPLIALWRECRQAGRIPTEAEINQSLEQCGIKHVEFDETGRTVRYTHPDAELNLGGIGKGYALDRAGLYLLDSGIQNWLLHGGHSSILAHGENTGRGGWPVGLRNPLFPKRRLGTILLRDQAISTSGSGVQYFRHRGKKYGHILDSRTGWPVEDILSVTVITPDAALADALSTAFFVMGLEKTGEFCHNNPNVLALLLTIPRQRSRKIKLHNFGVPEGVLFITSEDVTCL